MILNLRVCQQRWNRCLRLHPLTDHTPANVVKITVRGCVVVLLTESLFERVELPHDDYDTSRKRNEIHAMVYG